MSSEPDMGVSPRARTLLLGLGNDILKDDAIGLRVVAGVRDLLTGREAVTVVQSSEMGLALLDTIVGFENLVIVDAIETKQGAPGFVHEINSEDLSAGTPISPHFLGVAEILALGRELDMPVPHCVKIFAVEVQDMATIDIRMTRELEAALPEIVQRVLKEVTQL